MSLILCLDTATEICSVSISENGKLLVCKENHEGNKHASVLTLLIQECLDYGKITMQDLAAVAVSKGPGSYTGLRVGVSTAKGICYALQIPLLAINTLESLAIRFMETKQIESDALLIPMLDARRMEVYCAVFNPAMECKQDTNALIVQPDSFRMELSTPCYFFGTGAMKCSSVIHHTNAKFVDEVKCSAESMVGKAYQLFEDKQFEDVAYFEPYYLKDFMGTKAKGVKLG